MRDRPSCTMPVAAASALMKFTKLGPVGSAHEIARLKQASTSKYVGCKACGWLVKSVLAVADETSLTRCKNCCHALAIQNQPGIAVIAAAAAGLLKGIRGSNL